MLKERLNSALTSVLSTAAYVDRSVAAASNSIIESNEPKFGDYSSSVALKLAGSDSSMALSIAHDLASKILALEEAGELIGELSVVAPGYLNFHLSKTCLAQVFCQIHREKPLYRVPACSKAPATSVRRKQILLADQLQAAATVGFDPDMVGFTNRRDPIAFMVYVCGRCASLLRLAQEEYPNIPDGRIDPPMFDNAEWERYQRLFATESSVFEPVLLDDGKTLVSARGLALKLDALTIELEHSDKSQNSLRLFRYTYEVATALEQFRQTVRFQSKERALLAASLGVLDAGRQVLAHLLKRMGVAVPEMA